MVPGDKLKSDRLATLECLVEEAWWFLLRGKRLEPFEKKTGRTFENMAVFTKIAKFIYLVFHEYFLMYLAVNIQLSPCRCEVTAVLNCVEMSRCPVVVVVVCNWRC